MQKTLTTKLVATTIALVLIVALILCIAPVQTAHAEEAVWEKVDYETYFNKEITEAGDCYGGHVADITCLRKYRYIYVFMTGAGGLGGASEDGKSAGYGGGGGAFIVAKIDLTKTEDFIIVLGKGGGKFTFGSNDPDHEDGDGHPSSIWAMRAGTEQRPFALDAVGCLGGKYGTSSNPGEGAMAIKEPTQNNLMQLIYAQDGVDGGQASHSFSVDLGFRTEHFIYRPAGATPSGKGGGASVYHRGGDGGVLYKNGSDGSMGAGGGGAGRGATQGGYGGDAYMEIYGSNM